MLLVLLAASALAQESLPSFPDPCTSIGVGTWSVDLGEGDPALAGRSAVVYLPTTAAPADTRSAIVALHGGNDTPMGFVADADLARAADAAGAVLIAARGTGDRLSWHAGDGCCGGTDALGGDDVAYLDALAHLARTELCASHVLGIGFSAGGMMAHRWGWEGSEVDAVVSLAGPLLVLDDTPGPLPVWHLHGNADAQVPEGGREETLDERGYPSAEMVVEDVWCARNGCDLGAHADTESGRYFCSSWPGEADTRRCTIDGLDHAWLRPDPEFGPLADAAIRWFDGLWED